MMKLPRDLDQRADISSILRTSIIRVAAPSTDLFKFDYEDETLNDKQLLLAVQNRMHTTKENKQYIKGKSNSLHPHMQPTTS
jgi:hypothetical protein